jgi:hypothetical protein
LLSALEESARGFPVRLRHDTMLQLFWGYINSQTASRAEIRFDLLTHRVKQQPWI